MASLKYSTASICRAHTWELGSYHLVLLLPLTIQPSHFCHPLLPLSNSVVGDCSRSHSISILTSSTRDVQPGTGVLKAEMNNTAARPVCTAPSSGGRSSISFRAELDSMLLNDQILADNECAEVWVRDGSERQEKRQAEILQDRTELRRAAHGPPSKTARRQLAITSLKIHSFMDGE